MILALGVCTYSMAFAADPQVKEQLKADRDQVNVACSSDAQTAGCANEKVGTGLLRCLHGYKKSHKEFKFSDGCKTAMVKLKTDRPEKTEKK